MANVHSSILEKDSLVRHLVFYSSQPAIFWSYIFPSLQLGSIVLKYKFHRVTTAVKHLLQIFRRVDRKLMKWLPHLL